MGQIIGCLLIFSGTCFFAGKAGEEKVQRVLVLRDLIDGLEKLSRELSFRLSPLPELLQMIGRELGGEAGAFFSELQYSNYKRRNSCAGNLGKGRTAPARLLERADI